LVGERGNARVADGDRVEGLEIVYEAQSAALLFDAKPAGAIRGVGALIDSCGELLFEHLDNVV
jgi:hypothetical protein